MTEIGPTGGAGSTSAVVYDFSRAKARLAAKAAADPADRTGFTDEARELARTRQAVDAAPDIRPDRVEALKAQIARGEYKPDADAIAQKILERGL